MTYVSLYAYDVAGEGYAKVKKSKPSVAFVLTTWEKKGSQTTVNVDGTAQQKSKRDNRYDSEEYNSNRNESSSYSDYENEYESDRSRKEKSKIKQKRSGSGKAEYSYDAERNGDEYSESGSVSARGRYANKRSAQSESEYSESAEGRYSGRSKGRNSSASDSYDAKSGRNSMESASEDEFHGSTTIGVINEDLWKKIPDMQIVDRFQQEFKSKGFTVKAADAAREIALATTLAKTGIDPSDRSAVRNFAEKENVNFIARGEAAVLAYDQDSRGVKATLRIGVEIIDVNSGDVVASYSNTVTGSGRNFEGARSTSLVKMAVVSARSLASQTMESWVDAAENGSMFTIEVRNVTSSRSQKMPFEKALKSIGELTSQTSPSQGVQSYTLVFKGSKSDLGEAIIEAIGDKKGFEEDVFDGPNDENGKIVFSFK
jgi:hypothetical protein